jgi:hypothetical protein
MSHASEDARMSTSENAAIVEAAAVAIKARSLLDPPMSAPPSWLQIGIDLQYPRHEVVRLRPVDVDATSVEVFRREQLLASEILRGYRSPAHLAEMVEDVRERAIERASPVIPLKDAR